MTTAKFKAVPMLHLIYTEPKQHQNGLFVCLSFNAMSATTTIFMVRNMGGRYDKNITLDMI